MQGFSSLPKKSANLLLVILSTWLLVGTLDATGATLHFLAVGNKDARLIFKYIASAIFGKAAYAGGNAMVLAGIIFHYVNALLFTIFFFLIYPYIKNRVPYKLLMAVLYGIFMWLVMTFLVLPFTRIPRGVIHLKSAVIGIGILIIALGIPLAYIAAAYYKRQEAPAP